MALLHSETVDNITTVTISSPTMPPAFFDEIGDTFRAIAADPTVRAVVLRSDVKCFSYGLDLGAAFGAHGELFAGGSAEPRSRMLALIRRWQADLDAIAACPVPVIGAINGWCIGGGLDVASACDIRLADKTTKFSLRETKVAIVADIGSLQRLRGVIGSGHLRELAYTGKDIDAEHAARIGLVNAIHDDVAALHAAAQALAAEIAANAPLTVRGVKEQLRAAEEPAIRAGLEHVAIWNSAFLASEDLGEAVSAFMAKRPPVYKGK